MLHSRSAIVPTRFMVTISHLTAVIMCFLGQVKTMYHLPIPHKHSPKFARDRVFLHPMQESNVISGLDLGFASNQYDAAKSSFIGALSVTVICIATGPLPCLLAGDSN